MKPSKPVPTLVVAAALVASALFSHYHAFAQTNPASPATDVSSDLPVREVVLFSSGVGYFEHGGTVSGRATAELHFKTAQINDILKSLILQDEDGGHVTSVNYASQEPLQRKLKSFQVDLSAAPTLADLIGQLRGARMTIVAGDRTLSGTLLGIEKKQVAQGQTTVERSFISLYDNGTIHTENMDELRSIKLDDPGLQSELTRALQAMAGSRDQEKKSVQLRFDGEGTRRVRVGYVVEAPVWKTSYRLILGAKDTDKTQIQGWAIVENQTDRDWNDVGLSLVSGRPVSFVQDLYSPLFLSRPVVANDLIAGLAPQVYGGGVRVSDREKQLAIMAAPAAAKASRNLEARGGTDSAPSTYMRQPFADESPGFQPMNAAGSVASAATTAELGELFQYVVNHVTLPRQTSSMLPIVTEAIESEKVSIYNVAVFPRNPLSGVRLKNNTGKHLPAGPLTVLAGGAYAGDARIDNLPPGQERLLSYGVDLQVVVDAAKRHSNSVLQTVHISKGVLTFVRRQLDTQEYEVENKSETDRMLIIEQARMGGWELADPPKPFDRIKPYETTDAVYRFRQAVAGGKTQKVAVTQAITVSNDMVLSTLGPDDFVRFSSSAEIPQAVRDAFTKAAQLGQAVTGTTLEIEQKKSRIAEMTAEQNRIRENMRTVQPNSDYSRRLLAKLNDQESALEKLQTEIDALTETLAAQRHALEDYLNSLSF